jgi:hypothetical protein
MEIGNAFVFFLLSRIFFNTSNVYIIIYNKVNFYHKLTDEI